MKKNKILLYLMIIISLLLCIPSVIYLIINKTVDGFNGYYTYTLIRSGNILIGIISAVIIVGLLLIFGLLYILIVKNQEKIFKNKKQIFIFIVIISFIFMLILPFLSSDIFYYIGDSWLCSNYHENPYYTTVSDLQNNGINDEILNNSGYWKDTVSVYGPLYNIFAIILSKLSFGSITAALFIFKIASFIIHILNCYVIGKITKSRKYILLYGLNPLILIELLSNVHNDIYLILFLLLSLYFLIRKKNIYLTILFLILSIAIKYSTVLIVPFILLYYFKEKNIPKRILYCIISGVIIILGVILLYMPFYKDISIFTNMLVQGERYSQSLIALLMIKMKNYNFMFNIINILKFSLLILIYFIVLVKILLNKDLNFKYFMKRYNVIMLIFIFICLTNFQKWYVLWLFPTIIWQNKNMRNFIINLTIMGIVPSFLYFIIENDAFSLGIYYSFIVLVLSLICMFLENFKFKRSEKCQG